MFVTPAAAAVWRAGFKASFDRSSAVISLEGKSSANEAVMLPGPQPASSNLKFGLAARVRGCGRRARLSVAVAY